MNRLEFEPQPVGQCDQDGRETTRGHGEAGEAGGLHGLEPLRERGLSLLVEGRHLATHPGVIPGERQTFREQGQRSLPLPR